MSFAAKYLQKHALREPFIDPPPNQDLQCIVALPAYNESGLLNSLDSLYNNRAIPQPTEVIILINEPENAPPEVTAQNQQTYAEVSHWVGEHKRDNLQFHAAYLNDFSEKHAGAGLARKTVMDEAIYRFNSIQHPEGIIVSLDADTTVEENYFEEIMTFFKQQEKAEGCSIRFEHPLEGEEFRSDVYRAIINYELHQHYYLHAVRSTGYPYAFHTVGSCFAVRAGSYCRYGGMSRRQAGEDFYFIQKVASSGSYGECNTTMVYPSPRPSDRVPFGTGPDIIQQLKDPDAPYYTFHPGSFVSIGAFFGLLPMFYNTDHPIAHLENLDDTLREMLMDNGFPEVLAEIRKNAASPASFQKRFFRKFNMLWILKYLHAAEENGIPKMEIASAARKLLEMLPALPGKGLYQNHELYDGTEAAKKHSGKRDLLLLYRKLSFGS